MVGADVVAVVMVVVSVTVVESVVVSVSVVGTCTVVVIVCSYLSHRYYSFGAGRRRDSPAAPIYDAPAASED